MRVAHFCETLPGGIAGYLNEILPLQVEAYGDVTVFCSKQQSHLITCQNVHIECFDRYSRGPLGLARLWIDFAEFVKRGGFDVVHMHSTFSGVIGRLSPFVPRETSLVYCPHGWAHATTSKKIKRNLFKLVERLLSYRCDSIINISQSEELLALEAGISSSKCTLIYNGIHDRAWKKLRPTDRPTKLVFVGRFDKQKGFDVLMDAASDIQALGYALNLYGAPWYETDTIEIPESVIDNGWKSAAEVHKAIEDSDVVVMPSRWEGCSLVALEALRAGRPLIAANVSSLPEMVSHNENGILFAPDSKDSLVDALTTLLKSDISKMGIRSRDKYESKFTDLSMFYHTDLLYNSVRSNVQRDGPGSLNQISRFFKVMQ